MNKSITEETAISSDSDMPVNGVELEESLFQALHNSRYLEFLRLLPERLQSAVVSRRPLEEMCDTIRRQLGQVDADWHKRLYHAAFAHKLARRVEKVLADEAEVLQIAAFEIGKAVLPDFSNRQILTLMDLVYRMYCSRNGDNFTLFAGFLADLDRELRESEENDQPLTRKLQEIKKLAQPWFEQMLSGISKDNVKPLYMILDSVVRQLPDGLRQDFENRVHQANNERLLSCFQVEEFDQFHGKDALIDAAKEFRKSVVDLIDGILEFDKALSDNLREQAMRIDKLLEGRLPEGLSRERIIQGLGLDQAIAKLTEWCFSRALQEDYELHEEAKDAIVDWSQCKLLGEPLISSERVNKIHSEANNEYRKLLAKTAVELLSKRENWEFGQRQNLLWDKLRSAVDSMATVEIEVWQVWRLIDRVLQDLRNEEHSSLRQLLTAGGSREYSEVPKTSQLLKVLPEYANHKHADTLVQLHAALERLELHRNGESLHVKNARTVLQQLARSDSIFSSFAEDCLSQSEVRRLWQAIAAGHKTRLTELTTGTGRAPELITAATAAIGVLDGPGRELNLDEIRSYLQEFLELSEIVDNQRLKLARPYETAVLEVLDKYLSQVERQWEKHADVDAIAGSLRRLQDGLQWSVLRMAIPEIEQREAQHRRIAEELRVVAEVKRLKSEDSRIEAIQRVLASEASLSPKRESQLLEELVAEAEKRELQKLPLDRLLEMAPRWSPDVAGKLALAASETHVPTHLLQSLLREISIPDEAVRLINFHCFRRDRSWQQLKSLAQTWQPTSFATKEVRTWFEHGALEADSADVRIVYGMFGRQFDIDKARLLSVWQAENGYEDDINELRDLTDKKPGELLQHIPPSFKAADISTLTQNLLATRSQVQSIFNRWRDYWNVAELIHEPTRVQSFLAACTRVIGGEEGPSDQGVTQCAWLPRLQSMLERRDPAELDLLLDEATSYQDESGRSESLIDGTVSLIGRFAARTRDANTRISQLGNWLDGLVDKLAVEQEARALERNMVDIEEYIRGHRRASGDLAAFIVKVRETKSMLDKWEQHHATLDRIRTKIEAWGTDKPGAQPPGEIVDLVAWYKQMKKSAAMRDAPTVVKNWYANWRENLANGIYKHLERFIQMEEG